MFRPAFRSVVPRALPRNAAARRFLTTAPPHQTSRSWKNKALRLGLAGSIVYWYNTSSVFAEEPAYAVASPPVASREDENYQTIDSIAEQRRAQARAQQAASTPSAATSATTTAAAPDAEATAPGGPQDLEEEAGQQGAFNEETGEINWDCPCLGGMAHGPCGEQFRTAFSCFVFSKDEPKGVDCIEHFKGMQDCFREHPDIYGGELDDDDLEQAQVNEDVAQARQAEQASGAHEGAEKVSKPYGQDSQTAVEGRNERAAAAEKQVKEQHVPTSESEEMVPKSWHDTTDLNRTEK